MEFEKVIEKVRKLAQEADVSNTDFLAVQVNLKDCNPGTFYVEIKNHKMSVEPYEYIDRNCAITIKSDDFVNLLDKKLDPVLAFTLGKLKVEGDVSKALEFAKLKKKK
ncbi:MAG: SCP2 sterol-binding domain-containing protein [Lachnospiraceae bacterium]|nr:SCP2 sterol-binding domain-containing protein [Lachnospiraceae bacterium]